jgi:hypothetical protein
LCEDIVGFRNEVVSQGGGHGFIALGRRQWIIQRGQSCAEINPTNSSDLLP